MSEVKEELPAPEPMGLQAGGLQPGGLQAGGLEAVPGLEPCADVARQRSKTMSR